MQPEKFGDKWAAPMVGSPGYVTWHATREEAEAHHAAELARVARRAELLAREAAERDAAELERAARAADYADTLTPLAKGRALAVLYRPLQFRGRVANWREAVREMLAEGRTLETREGKPALVHPVSGTYALLPVIVSRYAAFLISSRE